MYCLEWQYHVTILYFISFSAHIYVMFGMEIPCCNMLLQYRVTVLPLHSVYVVFGVAISCYNTMLQYPVTILCYSPTPAQYICLILCYNTLLQYCVTVLCANPYPSQQHFLFEIPMFKPNLGKENFHMRKKIKLKSQLLVLHLPYHVLITQCCGFYWSTACNICFCDFCWAGILAVWVWAPSGATHCYHGDWW